MINQVREGVGEVAIAVDCSGFVSARQLWLLAEVFLGICLTPLN